MNRDSREKRLSMASVRTDAEDEAGQDRRVVSYRKQVIAATSGATPSQKGEVDVPASVCPRCQGRGWLRQDVPYGHPNFGKGVACACLLERRRKQRRMELLDLSELSEQQREQTLETYAVSVRGVQQAFRATKRLATSLLTWGRERTSMSAAAVGASGCRALPEEWLVLVGGVGVGKTHLAASVVNVALDAEIVVLFVTVPDLLDHLRATFDPGARGPVYKELFEHMRNAELLVLDDLGSQRCSPWADEKPFQLINHRYHRRLPTVITMKEQTWMYLDDRLQSRLSDQSLVKVVAFKRCTGLPPKIWCKFQ